MRKLLVVVVVAVGLWKLGILPFAPAGGVSRAELAGKWRVASGGDAQGLARAALSDMILEFFRDGTVLQSGGPFGNTGLAGHFAIDGTTVTVQLGPPGSRFRSGAGGVEYALSDDHDTLTTVGESGPELVYRRVE
ncbi:MAG: hypothetical protein U0807_06145 [Candidatus Binatia bacterium]